MTRREDLLERLEETVFALMMEEVISVEGRKALEENERLKADKSFVVPEETYRKGLSTIKKHFSRNTRQATVRTMSKLISRVAVIVLILLLLFTTAFATIPQFRAKTMNLITEVFDDRTRIEFGEVEQRASVGENDNLAGWLPEGFELVDREKSDIIIKEKYGNLSGDVIEVYVYIGKRAVLELDTEDANVKNIIVSGRPAVLVFKDEVVQIVCPMVESERIYHVRGENISEGDVFRVAENLNL